MGMAWLWHGAFADRNNPLPYRPSSLPDAYWQRCALTVIVDRSSATAIVAIDSIGSQWVEEKAQKWIDQFSSKGMGPFLRELTPSASMKGPFLQLLRTQLPERESYLNKVERAQELIRAGEIYQVNLAQTFAFQVLAPPFALFRHLHERNPAPFSAYLRWKKASLVSTSPERFLCKRGQRLETRPIKGTIPRGKTQEEVSGLRRSSSLL